MFNKLKQFKDLRDQGKKLQNALSGESETANSLGGKVEITMDGNLNISKVEIDPEALSANNKEKLQDAIKEAHNSALKKMQRKVAMKMQQMGDIKMPF